MDAASISALAGLVTSAAGTVGSASAQKSAGDATAKVAGIQAQGVTYKAETNATIDEYKADLTQWAGESNYGFATRRADRVEAEAQATADILARSTSRVMGRATAAYGAAGVSGGSSLYVLNDIATEGQLQGNLALYKGRVQAGDIRQQATLDLQSAQSQATIYRTMATAERTSGTIAAAALYAGGAAASDAATIAAGTTLMTGLGKVATGLGDLFDKGSSTTTTPTGKEAATASQAVVNLPTGVGQTSGTGSSY